MENLKFSLNYMFIIQVYQSITLTFSLGFRVMFIKQEVVDNLFSLRILRL